MMRAMAEAEGIHGLDTSVAHPARFYDYLAGRHGQLRRRPGGGRARAGRGARNTHEVAQRVAPGARVVYVDNDRCKSGCTHACWVGQAA
jgi:S-adenosyl methyltransferase